MRALHKKTAVRALWRTYGGRDPQVELAFLLQDWSDPYNVGGLFRVADACGAARVYLSGKTPAPPHPQISVTSLGNHRRVPFEVFAGHDEAIHTARSAGYTIVAVEIAEGAEDYLAFDWPERTCLVLGNEQQGVYTSTLRQCDSAVFIPMVGKGRSLNVHVAGAIVAFHVVSANWRAP